jgi:peptidoglycan/LPS O-acetylase OafA/YrhL
MSFFDKMLSHALGHGKSDLTRVSYLDGWRGLAISCVLIQHFFIVNSVDFGRFGVDIFFVLSGMLMSNILFIKKVALMDFYKKRISRIFPVFFVFVTVVYGASYVFQLSHEHENYLYTLFFLRSYFPESPNLWYTGLPIGHLWSLNVEEHCYILLSIITLFGFLRGREYLVLILLGLLVILLHALYYKYPHLTVKNYQIRTEIAASHLLLSAGYCLIKSKFEKYVFSWMPMLAAFIAFICYTHLVPSYFAALFSPFLLAFAVNHLDKVPDFIKSILSIRLFRFLGICSYSIYLWQHPFYLMLNGHMPFLTVMAYLIAALTVGFLSFFLIENPVRKYLNDKW